MAYANDVAASRRQARTASRMALPSTSTTRHTEKDESRRHRGQLRKRCPVDFVVHVFEVVKE
jgi:hypothetical protein